MNFSAIFVIMRKVYGFAYIYVYVTSNSFSSDLILSRSVRNRFSHSDNLWSLKWSSSLIFSTSVWNEYQMSLSTSCNELVNFITLQQTCRLVNLLKQLAATLWITNFDNRPYPQWRHLVVKRVKLFNMAILLNVFRSLSGQNIKWNK